jgi:hypothetical protein
MLNHNTCSSTGAQFRKQIHAREISYLAKLICFYLEMAPPVELWTNGAKEIAKHTRAAPAAPPACAGGALLLLASGRPGRRSGAEAGGWRRGVGEGEGRAAREASSCRVGRGLLLPHAELCLF